MPGGDVARKHTLGGAAGLALLAFALLYRFFPGVLHMQPQTEPPAAATSVSAQYATAPSPAMPWTPPPSSARTPSNIAAAQAIEQGTSLADALRMGPPVATTREVAALLKRARAAEEQGALFEPKEANATDLYRQVLTWAPNNTEAETALDRIGGALRDWTLAAIDRGDDNGAQRYLEAYAQMPHEDTELEQVRQRLKALRQILPMLARAASLMKEGHATEPPDANALTIYRNVLSIDPSSHLADAGLAEIERGYVDKALAAAAQDDFSTADHQLALAATIQPGSQTLLETRTRIDGIRKQRAESVLTQARSALDSGDADLAEQLAEKAQNISSDLTGLDQFDLRLRNARLYASLSPGQVVRDRFLDIAGSAPSLVVIPTGKFVMGSAADETGHMDNEEPQRHVRIDIGFALGQSEVTVGEFREFVRATGYVSDAEKLGGSAVYEESTGRIAERRGTTWQDDYRGERADENLPVVNVSWNDANAYVAWLSVRTGKHYRLPSETEFEYALRAGSSTRYSWGDGNPDKPLGNFTGAGDRSPTKRSWSSAFPRYSDGFWGPAPVKSFPPNAFGLYDMEGNVSEWVQDCLHDNYVRAPHDSTAWVNPGCAQRVVRGGSWGSDPDQVRSAFRTAAPDDTRSARVGIRIARDL
ncbi:MAG: SUMF1/EgtB/PvdO family nonheme iron enzyme [Rhodanobacter sp.]|jgi:formylglycine-generating enzyme required for sulfatase activity|nr:SUMF1/EgtB/PvdO family nonheme iron enzyme [Rhodanobacter sp.]